MPFSTVRPGSRPANYPPATTTAVPTARNDRRLTVVGLAAALLGPLTGGLGAVVALVVAAVLVGRGEGKAAVLLVALSLLAFAVTYVVIEGFFMPVSGETEIVEVGQVPPALSPHPARSGRRPAGLSAHRLDRRSLCEGRCCRGLRQVIRVAVVLLSADCQPVVEAVYRRYFRSPFAGRVASAARPALSVRLLVTVRQPVPLGT